MSQDEKTLYHPFAGLEGNEYRYPLKPTSKKNVAAVCDVQAKRPHSGDKIRCEYADQAGYPATEYEEVAGKRRPVFELEDVYSEFYVHAAMAQAQFEGCPKIIDVTEEGVKIVNEELFDALDVGVVNEAFLSFMAALNGTLSERLRSFKR